MMRGGGGTARRKHGDRASVITGLPEHPLWSIAACSARNKNAEDTVVSRCERFRLEQRARAIETTNISTLHHLYVSTVGTFSKNQSPLDRPRLAYP